MKPLTPEQDAFVRGYWEQYKVKDIASMMGISEERVREHGRIVGLKPRSQIRGLIERGPKTGMAKAEAPEPPLVIAASAWPDGWRIEPPTKAQLMGRR